MCWGLGDVSTGAGGGLAWEDLVRPLRGETPEAYPWCPAASPAVAYPHEFVSFPGKEVGKEGRESQNPRPASASCPVFSFGADPLPRLEREGEARLPSTELHRALLEPALPPTCWGLAELGGRTWTPWWVPMGQRPCSPIHTHPSPARLSGREGAPRVLQTGRPRAVLLHDRLVWPTSSALNVRQILKFRR